MYKSILIVLVLGLAISCGGQKTEKERLINMMQKTVEWVSADGFVDEIMATAHTPMEVSDVIAKKLVEFKKDAGFNNEAELDSLLNKYEKEQDKDFMKAVHNLDNAYNLKMQDIIGKMAKKGGMDPNNPHGMGGGMNDSSAGANPHGGGMNGANPHGGGMEGANPHGGATPAAGSGAVPNDDVHSKVKK